MSGHVTYAVVGLGSAGSFALRSLARAGHSVVGIEAGGVANDRSAVGGDTRLYRRLYLEGPEYHDLLERALELWGDANRTSPDSFVQCGALSIVEAASEAADTLSRYGERFGIPYRRLDGDELRREYPQHLCGPSEIGFLDLSGGFVRTDVVVRQAVEDARTAGAEVVEEQVLSVESTEAGAQVVTAAGTWQVEKVVVAAGARSGMLLEAVRRHTEPRRLLMTWFQAQEPVAYAPRSFPVFTRETGDHHMYGAPALDGRHVKVSGIVSHQPLEFEAGGYDYGQGPKQEELRTCEAAVAASFAGLHPVPVRSAVYPDLYSADRGFILDWADRHTRIFAATGFSGKGFKMCCALGEHAAQVLSGEAARLPAFALSRFDR
ncbi:hypothetical protein GCM10009823_29350 [Brevibacterium salitolerans]|uniref:FAD dependent oxidoreductase domain-containing protein n=1 Tax=Brevibacterium salitolerans TaxID=1403566 RepID=A0ABN2X4M4_9MICO